ncbi:ParM/StbA family protein [Eoetvoesiella caeni]
MFVFGLDIGYSNLKCAFGAKGGKVTTKVLPVGAAPLDLLPQQVSGGSADVIQLIIDGEKWVAGVEPERLQGWDRELHADYPSTKAYLALFYAALLLSEEKTIDLLVTGLPVNQYKEPGRCEALIDRLKGEHTITPKRTVVVKEVKVVPQPTGAFLDVIHSVNDEELLETISEGRTVVIDPGFFSVDWVLLNEGEVRMKTSGTSLKAMSVLLAEIDALIQQDHGAAPGLSRIEKAIRTKKSNLLLLGERISIGPYLTQASEKIAPNALIPMRQSLREEDLNADVVVLAGGGAAAYEAAAKEVFPRSRIVISDNSVLANARGFWHCA